MSNWHNVELLEMVESYAEDQNRYYKKGFIESEQELSERFDDMLAECYPDFDTSDQCAIDEFFNNWTDSLCQNGELHPEQYSKYVYIGKYDSYKYSSNN